MPYTLIAMLAAVVLGVRFLFLGDPSSRLKVGVATAVVVSFVIWWYFPEWMVVSVLLQVAVSLFVLLYLKAHPYAS